jgi:hypothetical protein
MVDLDLEDFGQPRLARGRKLERTAARHGFEPFELQQAIQNPSSNEPLQVITTLAPIETLNIAGANARCELLRFQAGTCLLHHQHIS